jgi:N-dimethylarginine dimethylaminohydrolase
LPSASICASAVSAQRLIPLNRDEATRHLAANIVWLDRRTVISSAATKQTNALLRGKGYAVIELDYSDLVRQWGSFRCAVCPIRRDPVPDAHRRARRPG